MLRYINSKIQNFHKGTLGTLCKAVCVTYFVFILDVKVLSIPLITTCIYIMLPQAQPGYSTKQFSGLAGSLNAETIISLIVKLAID